MKLNNFLIFSLVFLIFIGFSIQIKAMEEPPQTIASKITASIEKDPKEIKELLQKIERIPDEIKIKILKKVLTKGPDQEEIKKGIKYIQALSKTPELRNIVNDPIFVNWAIQTISKVLEINRKESAIELRTTGAATWLKTQAQDNPSLKMKLEHELDDAINKKSLGKIKFFLESGVDVNKKDNLENTPLITAAMKGYDDAIKILLEAHANINEKNEEGKTALMFAAMNGHEKTVELLLNKGANVNIKDNLGITALGIAEFKGYKKITELLKAHK